MASSTFPETVRPRARWNDMIGARRGGSEDAIGAAGEADPGCQERLLQRDDACPTLVVAGEAAGGRAARRTARATRASVRGAPSAASAAPGDAHRAGGPLVDHAGGREAVGALELEHTVLRGCSEDAVGTAPQRPSEIHDALLQRGHGRTASAELESDDGGRAGTRRRRRAATGATAAARQPPRGGRAL